MAEAVPGGVPQVVASKMVQRSHGPVCGVVCPPLPSRSLSPTPRPSSQQGCEAQNFLLMHAMGPNVAGVIGSAVAAGVMIKYVIG